MLLDDFELLPSYPNKMVGRTHYVPVDIVKRRNVFNSLCTQYTCYAAEDGTLADLRSVLEEDQIMVASDKFCAAGKNLGKSAERQMKWSTVLEVRIHLLRP